MAKYIYHLFLLCTLLLSSCQSVEQFSIDYMLPAEVSFPSALKRVAVVNNMPGGTDSRPIHEENNGNAEEMEIARITRYYYGNAQIATESLAEAIADENYFDEVVICDSALQTGYVTSEEAVLSTEEVNELTQRLDVDFLIALENVQLKAVEKVEYDPMYNAYLGTIDLNVYPTVRVYLPRRKGPMVSLTGNDSIYWEAYGGSVAHVRSRLISDSNLVKEASEFAGSVSTKQLLPYWKTATRYYFSGGSVNMRDAAIFVRENNWEKAIEQWKLAYQAKAKGKPKMCAAYNLALGYEMQDSIGEALEWIKKAEDLAMEIDKVNEKKSTKGEVDAADVPNYVMTRIYATELERRRGEVSLLNMQMERFE